MKFIKNNLKYLALAALVVAGLLIIKKQNIFKPFTSGVQQSQTVQQVPQVSVQDYFGKELEQELNTVWKSFEKIGLTKQRYEQAKQENRSRYLRSDFPGGSRNISQKTTQFVRGIIQELGLDPATITIVGFNDISPAAATERVIYINEPEFITYSETAKRFVIGHELQHILHKDNHSRYTLELVTHNEVEKMGNNKDHPLCQYNRFKEKRADVVMATQNKEWAQGYLTFAKEWHKRAGDNPGITHPFNKDRVVLAQNIVNYMNTQRIA